MGSVNECGVIFGVRRVKLSRKTEVRRRKFRFLVVWPGGTARIWGKTPLLCLEWGLQVGMTFELKSLTRVLDERMPGARADSG